MHMTMTETGLLKRIVEELISCPGCSVDINEHEMVSLNILRARTSEVLGDSEERVKELLDVAIARYQSDGDEYQISFDDLSTTCLSSSDDGAWVSCWAWVPYSDLEK